MKLPRKLLIFTDTTSTQVNGVNRSIQNLQKHLPKNIITHIISTDDFLSVPFFGYKEIRLSLSFPHKIRKIIYSLRPDYIHIATEWPLWFMAASICKKEKIPYTTSFHTKFPEYLRLRNRLISENLVHKYLRFIHNFSDTIFISNSGMIPYIERNDYGKYAIVPLGIDHTQFSPGEKTLFLEEKRPKILFVGRIAIEKNIKDFLEIDGKKFAKIIVWDGPERKKLELKYPDTLFLGIKKAQELTEIYRSVDVFIFPSKTDTLGLVNLEAMTCGKPVVAYNIENMQGIIKNNYNGILINENTPLEWGISDALKIPPQNCIQTASNFCWKQYAHKFLENQSLIYPKKWK